MQNIMPITRALEVEVMDTPEEARDYDAMDHAAVNRALVDDLLASRIQLDTIDAKGLPHQTDRHWTWWAVQGMKD